MTEQIVQEDVNETETVGEEKVAAGVPFCAGLGGVAAWLAADTDEASEEIAGWFSSFERKGIATPGSGVFARLDDGPQPHLTLIRHGEVVDASLMFAGPEWKRFTRIEGQSRVQYADTTLGPEPALEVRDGELVVLKPESWPLYLQLAHGWLLLESRELVGLHAAVTAVEDRALTLVGQSGAGKSTLSLALVERGAECFCDEWAFFRLPDLALFPWPSPLHVRPGGMAALGLDTPDPAKPKPEARHKGLSAILHPLSAWREARPGDPKCEVAVPKPGRPCPGDKVVFVFLDGFAEKPALSPVSGSEASRRLLSGMLLSDPDSFARLTIAADLVSAYPCALLKVGKPADTARMLIEYARSLP